MKITSLLIFSLLILISSGFRTTDVAAHISISQATYDTIPDKAKPVKSITVVEDSSKILAEYKDGSQEILTFDEANNKGILPSNLFLGYYRRLADKQLDTVLCKKRPTAESWIKNQLSI